MTKASERLRELAHKTDDPEWSLEVNDGWLIDLAYAIPLIADVVEAAERLTDEVQRSLKVVPEPIPANAGAGELRLFEDCVDSRAALTALRVALQPELVEPPAPDPKLVRWASGKKGSPPPPEGATAQSDFWRPTGKCPEC